MADDNTNRYRSKKRRSIPKGGKTRRKRKAEEYVDFGDEESVTRCICGFDHDDEHMICCDKCNVWQHTVCIGLDPRHVPQVYYCDECEPRNLNVQKAWAIQRRKAGDNEGEEFNYRYEANDGVRVRHERSDSRSGSHKKQKRRDSSTNRHIEDSPTNDDDHDDTIMKGGSDKVSSDNRGELERQLYKTSYETVNQSIYTDSGIKYLQTEPALPYVDPPNPWPITEQVEARPLGEDRRGLFPTEPIITGQYVCEYIGKILPTKDFMIDWEDGQYYAATASMCPFVLCVPGGLALDARNYGNCSRFVRRSCTPNLKVSCFQLNGARPHFAFYAINDIDKDQELTVGFDFDYRDEKYVAHCTCGKDDCVVTEAGKFKKVHLARVNSNGQRGPNRTDPDKKGSLVNRSGYNSSRCSSDDEDDNEGCWEGLSEGELRTKREERKLQLIMHAIQRMEKNEVRKKILREKK
eukprot:Ihof_evm1s864 gene=Ihof_evmTU1s864